MAKVEIERRLLAAGRLMSPKVRQVSSGWRVVALVSTVGFVVLGAVNLYAWNGRPDLANMAPVPMFGAGDAVSALPKPSDMQSVGNVESMIDSLAERLRANPTDAEGWRMLGWSYYNTQHYQEAADAYAKAVELVPDSIDYQSAYAEALVQAADGIVTPRAQQIFSAVLQKDPKENRARFYEALGREQAGDLDGSLGLWTALLKDAPADAGWVTDIKTHIADLSAKTGRKIEDLPVVSLSGEAKPGADQQGPVDSMIAKLAARLEASPRDRDGWAMMIRSLQVRGDTAGAEDALKKAMAAFADDPSTRNQIAGLAQSLGVGDSEGASSANSGSAPVISQDQIAAAQDMPADSQRAMVEGMVEKLSVRLAQSPHDEEGWVRLIRSRVVLKQADKAKEALQKALSAFAAEPAARDSILAAAREMGVVLD
jgi:cytochrome c-type biogenesis protein CcmH